MSRWRPPRPKSSPYITQEGFTRLQQELSALWDRRKHVTQALSEAAAEGDRSENAEYIYRKKELREIDRRIHYLQKRLPILNIVNRKPDTDQKVFFGAWVTLEKSNGEEVRYRIVGADEIGASPEYISLDSPLAQRLMKKELDDEILWMHESIATRFIIIDIEYSL